MATESRRLNELRVGALEVWADAELALGHHAMLAPELGRLITEHPLRERLHGARMLALYRDGRQADALAAYRELRTTLDEELGVEPSQDVRVLHERILRQDPALRWHPNGHESAPSGSVADTEIETSAPAAKAPRGARAAATWGYAALRRRWIAVAAVLAVAAALLVGAVVTAARIGVTQVPPNSAALVTNHGLAGEAAALRFAPAALATGADAVWAANENDDALVKIDPDSRRVLQTIHGVGGSPQAIAVSAGDVWVAGQGESVVTRINIRTDKVVAKVPVGIEPAALVATSDAVWVANAGDNTVQRIDIGSSRADAPLRVGDGPAGLALDGATLWIANSRSSSVTQLDTRTGQRVAADIQVDAGPRGLALTPTDVWVANELGQTVSRVNRATGVVTRVTVDDGPASIVIVQEQPWVANASSATLSRIDPSTNTVSSIDVGSSPRGLAVLGSDVWMATGALGNREHVGGTLIVEAPFDASVTIDPASQYMVSIIDVLRPVYDGLVAFRAAGGRASTTVVPNLATSLPTPTDGGRTYVFTLRDGIRYSTGATVTATDVALGLRRAILGNGNPTFYRAIVGAARCIDERATPDRCDLSQGVDADDATRRVTIRLVEPDPELLYKLAYFVVPAPPGTPVSDLKRTPLPGTGPYAIASSGADGSITLVRNPHFRQWSAAAQPQGYPDEIHYRPAENEAAVADVLDGRADVVGFVPPTMRNVGQSHPALVHEVNAYHTDFAYLNTQLAPFDDVRVRRALNYAVDRRTLSSLYGGGEGYAGASCQMLPPAFPGYRRYCPYQTGAVDGTYLGPDLEAAKRLVAESGAATTPITVHSYRRFGLWEHFADYLASVLRSIGFTSVQVQDIPPEHERAGPEDPAYATYQIFTQLGWLSDYPVASTFYDHLASCQQPNFLGYCNRRVDEIARRAFSLEQSDPNTAIDLWAQVDRMLTDDAAFVTLGNRHTTQLVSERVGNYLARPGGMLLSQLWVS